ncbi:MAG: hypothetical protein M0R77_00720 [Gammaproteobacteria bacterium]|nr:hypothetical protein [Acholeplasmataceae bacterium]MCK9529077.1 hypothetical protein [Gammaproteobacteria bacterium]
MSKVVFSKLYRKLLAGELLDGLQPMGEGLTSRSQYELDGYRFVFYVLIRPEQSKIVSESKNISYTGAYYFGPLPNNVEGLKALPEGVIYNTVVSSTVTTGLDEEALNKVINTAIDDFYDKASVYGLTESALLV